MRKIELQLLFSNAISNFLTQVFFLSLSSPSKIVVNKMLVKKRFSTKLLKGLSELRVFWGQIELIKVRNKNLAAGCYFALLQMIPVA